MRLPNFADNIDLNELRRQMGAMELGDLILVQSRARLTIAELEVLITGGIDIQSLDEIIVLPDGTLAYRDRRVILYIRDVAEYGRRGTGPDFLPKYHVSNCQKLRDMRAQNRYSRYVVAARADGSFQINLIRDSVTRGSLERLNVCQYCLGQLAYKNFSNDLDRIQRRAIVEAFTVAEFFSIWARDLVDAEGLDNESSAPLNDYSGDFGQYATATKVAARWTCRDCQTDLNIPSLRRYLHAHHANGIKFDNSPTNLVALCISCHAGQPGHQHMQTLADLADYRARAR